MSYSFNGAGTTYLRGTLTTAINIGDAPITIAAWFKTSSTDMENAITAFSSDTGTVNRSLMLSQGNPGSYLTARSTSTTGATNSATATTPGFVDAGWFPGIELFNATNDRDIYYGPSAKMGDFPSTTPNDAGTGMDVVTVIPRWLEQGRGGNALTKKATVPSSEPVEGPKGWEGELRSGESENLPGYASLKGLRG